ncbi:MAG TPA: DNA polymerase [Flavobacteriales bacterium]|nr:DNA polymerase [Flavobacteriales bacterium]
MSLSPFDYLNSINMTKNDIMVDEQAEKEYVPFIVNRGLSFFQDTTHIANEMNRLNHLDSKLQYLFYINIVNKKKRFSKWMKASEDKNLETVKTYYGYSNKQAKSALSLLSQGQIDELKDRSYEGGRTKAK